jgi:hypothetical protein
MTGGAGEAPSTEVWALRAMVGGLQLAGQRTAEKLTANVLAKAFVDEDHTQFSSNLIGVESMAHTAGLCI